MNTKIKTLLASLLIVTTASFAGDGTQAATPDTAGNGILYGGQSITHANSPHNLGSKTIGDNGEVCVYCHTPHAANVGFAGAPLWNKDDNSTKSYSMYGGGSAGTGTLAGTTTTGMAPNNPSLACLSCHDGVSAVDSILNAPGSGMKTIVGSKDVVTILGGPASSYGGNIGGVPTVVTVGSSVDLANDHPVSIPYMPGRASLRATTDTLPVGTGGAWVTPGGGTTVAALLRSGNVECSSCHDPHNATGVPQATAKQVNYLRHTNTGSELCFGCHNK